MKFSILSVLALWSMMGMEMCSGQIWTKENLPTYEKFDEMEYIFNYDNDTTYVINFWATWCGPCVKELPYFEELPSKDPSGNPMKVILVSLDFKNQLESKLLPYLNKNKIQSEVIFLRDSKYNDWIDRVDPEWSGSIPITIIYNQKGRVFLERDFHSAKEIVAQIPN